MWEVYLHAPGWNDILFVAPYNHQVSKFKSALGNQVKVGTIDIS